MSRFLKASPLLLLLVGACTPSVEGTTGGPNGPGIGVGDEDGNPDQEPGGEQPALDFDVKDGLYSFDFLETKDDCDLWGEILDAPHYVTKNERGGLTLQAEGSDYIIDCEVLSVDPVTFDCKPSYSNYLTGWEATSTVQSHWQGTLTEDSHVRGTILTDVTCANDAGSDFDGCFDYADFTGGFAFPCRVEEAVVGVPYADIPQD